MDHTISCYHWKGKISNMVWNGPYHIADFPFPMVARLATMTGKPLLAPTHISRIKKYIQLDRPIDVPELTEEVEKQMEEEDKLMAPAPEEAPLQETPVTEVPAMVTPSTLPTMDVEKPMEL